MASWPGRYTTFVKLKKKKVVLVPLRAFSLKKSTMEYVVVPFRVLS